VLVRVLVGVEECLNRGWMLKMTPFRCRPTENQASPYGLQEKLPVGALFTPGVTGKSPAKAAGSRAADRCKAPLRSSGGTDAQIEGSRTSQGVPRNDRLRPNEKGEGRSLRRGNRCQEAGLASNQRKGKSA
jgi:hypothetical protein